MSDSTPAPADASFTTAELLRWIAAARYRMGAKSNVSFQVGIDGSSPRQMVSLLMQPDGLGTSLAGFHLGTTIAELMEKGEAWLVENKF